MKKKKDRLNFICNVNFFRQSQNVMKISRWWLLLCMYGKFPTTPFVAFSVKSMRLKLCVLTPWSSELRHSRLRIQYLKNTKETSHVACYDYERTKLSKWKKSGHLTNFFEFGYENSFLFFKKIVVYLRLGISILKQL